MAKKKKGAVGVVGLGIMGGAFAENLRAAGWRVIGYDVAPARRRALGRIGVEIAADAGEVARQAQVIILSLPKPAALAATVAAIAGAKVPRRVVIVASTFKLEDKAAAEVAMRKAGHVLLDCPVSGPAFRLKQKILSFTPRAGRPRSKSFARCSLISRARSTISAHWQWSRMKYVANLLVAINNVAIAEAMVLGIKAGLPPQLIYDQSGSVLAIRACSSCVPR